MAKLIGWIVTAVIVAILMAVGAVYLLSPHTRARVSYTMDPPSAIEALRRDINASCTVAISNAKAEADRSRADTDRYRTLWNDAEAKKAELVAKNSALVVENTALVVENTALKNKVAQRSASAKRSGRTSRNVRRISINNHHVTVPVHK